MEGKRDRSLCDIKHTCLLVCVRVYVWVLDKTEKALLSQCIMGAVTTLNFLSMLKHSY